MSKPTPHLGVHHVALRVPDMEKARWFYVDLLGYSVEWEPDAESVYLTRGTDNLALHLGAVESDAQRLDHMGFIVAEAAHVGEWEAFLKTHGVEIAQATKTHRDGATSCYVRDPAGTLVQFLHHPPISPALSKLPSTN